MAPMEPAKALALLLETAYETFDVLQQLVLKEIEVRPAKATSDTFRFLRAQACLYSALAKAFISNVARARRICEQGADSLPHLPREDRKAFIRNTEKVTAVRDVNEHGYDLVRNKSHPQLHLNGGGYIDETSISIIADGNVRMGPLNLNQIYEDIAHMRGLAGFTRLAALEFEARMKAAAEHPAS